MKSQMHLKRIGSFLLTLIIISSTIIVASAATALKTSNVSQWPTLSYKNTDGVVHFGQTLEEALVINDDEIVLDSNGNQVAGHFEFMKPDLISNPKTGIKANIKFVPDNTEEYTGFNKLFSSLVYDVEATTPVYVDEVNDPVVASKIDAGSKLYDSVLSGGKMKNPYNANEPGIAERAWEWEDPETIVTKSGYYTAIFIPVGYTKTTAQVYVELNKVVTETTVSEAPSISDFTYSGKQTWSEIALNGGVAVEEGTTNIVEGSFEFSDYWKNKDVTAGTHNINVKFIPADTDSYLGSECTITVTVAPKTVSFKDADGKPVIGEFVYEVEPNEKMSNVLSRIKKSIIAPENTVWKIEDNNGYAKNGQQYKISLIYQDSNYTGTELTFTAKFKEINLEPNFTAIGDGKWQVQCKGYTPKGTFTVYAILNGDETKIGEAKGDETINWKPEATGTYTFRIEYTRAEEDYFVINNVTSPNLPHNPDRYFTATGTDSTAFKMGQTVKVVALATDPAMAEKPYYGFVGWTVVSGNPDISEEQLASAEFEFAMPDENVELKANYKFSHELYFKWIWQQIVDAFRFVISAFKELFGLAFVV